MFRKILGFNLWLDWAMITNSGLELETFLFLLYTCDVIEWSNSLLLIRCNISSISLSVVYNPHKVTNETSSLQRVTGASYCFLPPLVPNLLYRSLYALDFALLTKFLIYFFALYIS